MTSRPGLLVVAIAALAMAPWTAAVAGPGSGSASITPSAAVSAGATGTWSVQYTAAENMKTGRVRVNIPAGWTAPQTGNATDAGYVTVSTNQPSGNPLLSVGAQVITIDVDTLTTGNTLTVVYGNDSGGANPGARAVASTTPGPYTFLVASDPTGGSPTPIAASPSLTVIAAAASHLEIAPSDTSVTAGTFVEYRIIARDDYGNRATVPTARTVQLFPAHGQFFLPSDHGTPIAQVNIASGKTSVRVDYRGTLATAAGLPHSIFALTSGGTPVLAGSDDVNIVAAGLSTGTSTVSATTPVVANGSAQSSVTVTSKDGFGNPRGGDTVVIGVTGTALKTGPGGPTGTNGQAVGVVTNTTAQNVTVSATINGQPVVATAQIQFVAGPVSASTSVVDATTPVVANGIASSTVTITAKDANGNPVAGQAVTLSIVPPGAGAVLTQPGGVTNALGITTGTLASTGTGPRTVSATVGATPITDTAVVNFVAGSVASFQWNFTGSATAGVSKQVTLTALDAQGHVITDYTGLVNLTTNSTGVGNGVVEWSDTDALGTITNLSGDDATYQFAAGDNGVANLRITDTKAETIILTASGPASGVSGSLVVAPGAADKVQLVAGNGQTATVNTAVLTPPKVQVQDAFDNPVPGASVKFRYLTAGGFVDAISGGGVDSTATTASDGTVDCDVWRMATSTGLNPNRLRALITGGSVPSVDFTATATAGPGANLVLTPGSKSVTVNANETVTATLTDAFGNLKSGEQVTVVIKAGLYGTLAEDPGDPGTTTPLNPQARQGTTDAAGKITVRYVAPAGAGLADVLDASTPNVAQSSVADVTYTTTASGATNLRITFVGPSTKAAGQAAQFTVEAVDGGGNVDTGNTSTITFTPEGGSGLQFSLTDFGATITQATLVAGVRTIYVRGTLVGDWDIMASGGGLGPDTDAITVTDTGVIASYDVSTVAGVVAGAPFNVSVSARDQYGNLVIGANNSITLEAIDDVTTSLTGTPLLVTDASLSAGLATVGESYTKAEAIRVRVSNAGKEGTSGVLTVSAAAAKRIAKVSGDGSGIAAGSNRTLITQVLDPYDNPVSGVTVTFLVLQGGGSVLPTATPSIANGNASTTLTTGVVAGDNHVRASIDDGSPAIDEQVEFSVVTTAGGIAYFTVVPQTTSLTAGQAVPLTITAYDAGNNVVTSDNSTQVQLSSSGSAQFGAGTGTLTAGVFATTVRNDVVQNFTVTAEKLGGGPPSGTSASISVTNAGTYQIAKVSGDGSGITAGATRDLQAIVRDVYNNPVPGALVTFSVASAPDGTWSFTDTSGDPDDGIAVANASGVALVTYHTAQTAGANNVNAQILDGAPAGLERVTFTVTTTAGSITYYTVGMNATTTTAGVSKTATVTAYDVNDNVVDDDVTQVDLSGDPGIGLVFGADPVTLTNGVASTTVTANLVQTYRVRASTLGQPGITGLGPNVNVVAAAPAGTITATATQNTITANGTSTTTITSGVIRDQFTNQVAQGLNVNVSAGIGGVIVGGSPRTIGADGRISFVLQSSTSVGTCIVTMTSATGTATGSINIEFAPKPVLACNTPPTPGIVVPGALVGFTVPVTNTSATSVSLTTATTFSFNDGVHTYTANLSAPQIIPGSGGVTLVFNAATIDAAFVPANYAPVVTLIGADAYGAPVNVACQLPAASLKVTSIEITSIVPFSGVVSRGQSSVVAVTIKNNGTQSTTIDDVDLAFNPSALITVDPAPELGSALASGASGVFNMPIHVQAGAAIGSYQIDAVATGTVGGQTVSDNSVAPYPLASLQVTAAASLSYVGATLAPTVVTRGDAYAFSATIRNDGGGLVVLDSMATRLTFTDGARTFSVAPVQPYAIAGGGATQSMTFRSATVPANFTPGSYPVTLDAHGTENGAGFSQAIPLTGSTVLVETPAAIASVPGNALHPDQVSKTTTATFAVDLQNTGGATVMLDHSTTTLKFASNQYSVVLNPTGPITLPPGTTTLQFLGATVSAAITPGTYFPAVQLTGSENGTPFSQLINLADGVVVENAPAIAILGIFPSQTQFTQDQAKPIKVRMVVSNSNGAAATFTSASLRFIHAGQDRTGQFVISTPTTFSGGPLLTSGEIDTVVFDVSDNAGTMSVGDMTIEGNLEVEDVNTNQPVFANTNLGGKGNLQVMTPAAITFDAVIPSQTVVTQNMTKLFKVRAVVRNTGGSDAVLTLSNPSTRLQFSSPGWVVTSPATLAGGGSTLSGGEVDTLIYNVTTSGSAAGLSNVSAVTAGIETNSGRSVSGTSGSTGILVQTAGVIQVTSIVPSRASITSGSTVGWTVTVTLTNTGQSDINLALDGAVALGVQSATTQPAFTVPGTLVGGGTLLSGGETDQLVISLTTAGTYSAFGARSITVGLSGTEVNSGVTRGGGGSNGSVIVQQAPDVAFVSLTPGTVSKLTNVAFAVTVNNPVAPNGATMTLDRSLSRLRFGSNQFNVGLTQASPVDVAGGAQTTLQFTAAVVAAGIPLGVQTDAQLELHWTHNGVAASKTIGIGSAITVENAPSLNIVSVRPSRATMTRNQTNAGTVTMVVQNSGGAAVGLDLSSSVTRLGFKVLGSGATVTGEYSLVFPTALEGAGGTVLAGGAVDSLVFDVTQAGSTTGSIIVNGYVGGTDLNSSQPVSDDTFDGGSGNFVLQLAGALSILSITPAQPTATVGQTTKSYPVKMAVKNTGGAAIDVSLSPSNSFLTFSPNGGWVVNAPTMTGGVTLTGGETDTLRFLVTTTGTTPGVATIGGTVYGIENNTGTPYSDDTLSGGTGSITLQTPALLVIDSVTPSRPSVTTSTSAVWYTTVALHNAGQSSARLNLPAGFTISIQSSTGGTVFVKPNDLEEGGVILAGGASGTLVATTTTTGTFSTLGTRSLNVGVGATEVNSNRAFSQPGAGSIVLQSAPNLVVTAARPTLVTSGSLIDFEVDVQNPGGNSATVRFNRATTRVHFASQAYSAFLDVASPDSIVGGQTVTLRFEGKVVSPSIAIGPYPFNVNLAYNANSIVVTEPEVAPNPVTVQSPPQLFIQSIVVSQPTVTAGQTRNWTATMTVVNNGSAVIDLNLATNKTFLTFVGSDAQPDPSYVWNPAFMPSGDEMLDPAETDQIVFTIDQTGTKTGNIVISGRVEGTDVNQQSPVIDDTFDGGRGGIVVQTPASVAVTAIHPAQPEVTVGQGGWGIRVLLANTGGADVAINLSGTDLSFLPAPGWAAAPTQPLFGGGNILEGGAVDSLLIPIYEAGDNIGPARIDVIVPWTELNSLNPGVYDTEVTNTGYGAILVEDPADIRIFATRSAAPNVGEVNTGQTFNIEVVIQNRGQADARSIVVDMTTNGGSVIQPAAPLDRVPGGQSVSYFLPVQAAAVPALSETFTTSITSAVDDNSGVDTLLTISNALDATAPVAVQTPAVLDITGVRPSQPSVTRGQANPWSVIVALQNTGQADAVLTPPAAGDLGFSIAGATKLDYVVQAPTKFGSGAAGWTLPGGATDSLVYSIISTGDDPGTVDIALGAAGTDRNDPPQTLADTGATTVSVQDVAGLFIATTVPVGTFNHANAARDTVNTSFAYQIHVTVQNTGGEDVDSVRVQLTRDGSSSIAPASLKRESIAAGGNRVFVFGITSPAQTNPLETFTATILPGVKSHNSGQTVIPQAPVDNLHQVVIQTPANLSTDLFIASPPGSAGGVVSPNQQFTLAARVSNLGQARVSGPAEVTLSVPAGFGVIENLVRAFAPDDTVKWTVTAPPAPQSALNFSCAITTPPNDVNLGATAFVSKASDTQSVTVSTGGALASPTLVVFAPAGATDDTLSVLQNFTLRASVTPTADTKSVVATLTVPGTFSIVGSAVRNLGNGPGTKQVDYSMIAPSSAVASATLFVTFTGIDGNSGDPVPSSADTVLATVVPRTSLSVSAAVTAPPDAIDNTVAIGTPFTVTAAVTNVAGAADIAAPGNLQITLPSGYSLASGHTAVKPFVVGVAVEWVVNAASQPSGPDQIAITISSVPADENSGLPALVTAGTANIAMVTEGAAVSVRDVSSSLDVGSGVAPGGAKNLDVLAFEIAYNVTDPSVSAAAVDTIALTIIDKNGSALSAGTVAQTLARVAVDLGGASRYEVIDPSANPVIISLVAGGTDRIIAPDGAVNAVVYLDLDANPRATEIRVRVRGGGMVVRDTGSGQALGVTDAQGRPLDGQITSGPLVVLSSNFQEYAHNYPNPFRAGSSETRIAYFLAAPADVTVKIYDITGELVYEESIPSSDARAQSGPQEATWDGRNMKGDVVRNGIYVCVLNAGSQSAKFRIAVAK